MSEKRRQTLCGRLHVRWAQYGKKKEAIDFILEAEDGHPRSITMKGGNPVLNHNRLVKMDGKKIAVWVINDKDPKGKYVTIHPAIMELNS